jgi:hypothetical protein
MYFGISINNAALTPSGIGMLVREPKSIKTEINFALNNR